MFNEATFQEILLSSLGWWEKYHLKHNLIKHTCSWHDKLVKLLFLNFSEIFTIKFLWKCFLIYISWPAFWQNCLSGKILVLELWIKKVLTNNSAWFWGPILESKGMHAIFQERGGERERKMLEKGKIFEKWEKTHKIWKYFEKRQVIACDYRIQ